ncbi:MAG: FAD-binding protein [Deltaproteobacteria bacterium]|nr:FAD-binding protein [Deltaproteobacteria bacterium]
MKDQDEKKKGLTRRNFIKTAAAGAGVVALSGFPGRAQALDVKKVRKWDMEADVVVVGFGGAGANAAISAHDAGANVLLLEKMPEGLEGGNTVSTGAGTVYPWNPEKAVKHEVALSMDSTSKEYAEALVKVLGTVLDRYKYLGVETKKSTHNYSHYFCTTHAVAGPDSPYESGLDQYLPVLNGEDLGALFEVCLQNVKKRGIKVAYGTAGKQLVTNPSTNEVLGIVAEQGEKKLYIKAKRGVVLTCGGYENNPQMVAEYNFPGYRIYPGGTPGNTGDGITMCQSMGAAMWHFPGLEVLGFGVRPVKEGLLKDVGIPFKFSNGGQKGAYIVVNRFGKRFWDETKKIAHTRAMTLPHFYFDGWCDDLKATNSFINQPGYIIFDESFRKQASLIVTIMSYHNAKKTYEWSRDNMKEIESGLITKADSIEELGSKLKIDTKDLAATVAAYNKAGTQGDDPVFGRRQRSIVPIEKPPFYGCQLDMLFINTQGGPVHSPADARVLDTQGNPIPRLYAAGELGSFWSWMYHGSGNIPEAIVVGAVAGDNVAKEKPWK